VTEAELYAPIFTEFSRGDTRLFRQQSALVWGGTVVHRTANTITLLNPHAIKLGTSGMSDLGGLTSVVVTEADIGRRLAIYVACELKSARGRPTAEQEAFIAMVRRLGGRAGVARSVEEAGRIIRGDALT
jgi:hypothetical protein